MWLSRSKYKGLATMASYQDVDLSMMPMITMDQAPSNIECQFKSEYFILTIYTWQSLGAHGDNEKWHFWHHSNISVDRVYLIAL